MSSAKHVDLVSSIVKAHYAATGEQVEQLAFAVAVGLDAGTVYLRVVLAHMQGRLGTRRRATAQPQEPVLDTIHEELYPHVLKGVGPDEMPAAERNSKANFARTMASTVRFFIQHGGDVRALDVTTATKNGLRKAVQPAQAEAPEGATRAMRGFLKAREGLTKSLQRLARGDPQAARDQLEQLLDEYERMLGELAPAPVQTAEGPFPPRTGVRDQMDPGATTTIVAGRSGAGRSAPAAAPMLHRGA